MKKKAEKSETITIPVEKAEEICGILQTACLKLGVVENCCQNMNSADADGIEIIAFEISGALYEAKEILEEAQDHQEQEVSA